MAARGRQASRLQPFPITVTQPPSGRLGGGLGIAGGAPGINALLESNGTWTTIVLSNLDPPSATRLGLALQRQLAL